MSTAWIAGGSGLVGSLLLEELLAAPDITRVVAVGRRPLGRAHDRLVDTQVDFGSAQGMTELPAPALAFSCLGTTMRKAGSRAAFRAVDHDAVLHFAQAARARGAAVFVHLSSLGADPRARSFYLAVKGEIEQAIAGLGFASAYALRPSILEGARRESRPLERVGLAVGRAFGPLLGKYRPTPAGAVAATMLRAAREARPGAHIIAADDISASPRSDRA